MSVSRFVVMLPGLTGSNLYLQPDIGDAGFVWPNKLCMLNGGIRLTQLGPDGGASGPLAAGSTLYAKGPDPDYYFPLLSYLLSQKYIVFPAPYDWRMSIVTTAAKLYAGLQNVLPGVPIQLVCHSMGGLVARLVYGHYAAAGQAALVQRIICLGTPHYGSWATHQIFWRVYIAYLAMLAASALLDKGGARGATAALDACAASWPSFYEVLPFAQGSWVTSAYAWWPTFGYDVSLYEGANAYLVGNWFGAALATQQVLAASFPKAIMAEIDGTGIRTPNLLAQNGAPGRDPTYFLTAAGDGVVPNASSGSGTFPVNVTITGVEHANLPRDSRAQAQVASILASPPPGA